MVVPSSSSLPTLEQLALNVVWLCLTLLIAKKTMLQCFVIFMVIIFKGFSFPCPCHSCYLLASALELFAFSSSFSFSIYVQTQAWSSLHFHSCPLLHLCSNPSSTPLGSPNPTIVLGSKISKKLIN